jgi:hypothetical protein
MRTGFILSALAAVCTQVSAHLVFTYPGWRGDNLHSSGLTPEGTIPQDGLGANVDSNGTLVYPYGMQWIYPCKLLQFSEFTRTDYLTGYYRWWHGNVKQQNKMGNKWWCSCISTRLVFGSSNGFYLYQPWSRHIPVKYVLPNGTSLPNYWPFKQRVPGNLLLTASSSTTEFKFQHWR